MGGMGGRGKGGFGGFPQNTSFFFSSNGMSPSNSDDDDFGFPGFGGGPSTFQNFGNQGSFGSQFAGNAGRKRSRANFDEIPSGTEVLVHGLKSAEHLNHAAARVVSYDNAADRYAINFQNGKKFKIKRSNIQQLATVELSGLHKRPELNGKHVRIVQWDTNKERYIVKVGNTHLYVGPAHVILPSGSRGTITGLRKAPQWNGKHCAIKSYNKANGKYIAQVSDTRHVAMKKENVILV
mmetsp:Transcript_3827/g.5424  ORF Transcript_3827/g.5424 Transcript_3827/m.5424 type:complete len:237 (+) Transcript_3827:3-713(+)